MMRYFISLTSADRIVLIDEPGLVLVDERTGVTAHRGRPARRLPEPPRFQLPPEPVRGHEVRFQADPPVPRHGVRAFPAGAAARGTCTSSRMSTRAWSRRSGRRRERRSRSSPGPRPSSPPLPGSHLKRRRRCGRGASSWATCRTASISRPLSADIPDKIYLVAFRSQLAEQVYIRSVLFTYLTAFLITLAASLFLAAGFTSLAVSPFTRLAHWLHRYMDTGEVGKLDIRSRDEIGFLAGHVPRDGEHPDQREERHQRPAGPDQRAQRLQRAAS